MQEMKGAALWQLSFMQFKENLWQRENRQPYFFVKIADMNPANGWDNVRDVINGIPLWRKR